MEIMEYMLMVRIIIMVGRSIHVLMDIMHRLDSACKIKLSSISPCDKMQVGGAAMEYIVTALITGGLSLLGVIITNISANKKIEMQLMNAQAVTDVKLEQLTDEVRKHNSFADRITTLEVKVDSLEKKVANK